MVIQSDKISDRKKKDSIKIATWNVRTLYQKGKLDNVNQEMDRMNLNILGLSEVRWTGAGSQKINNKTFIYSGGTKHERGTGILFDEPTARCLKAWCPISDRVIVAKLEAKPLDIGIIQVYAPTSDSEDEEVERFYEEIDRAKAYLKSQDIKIVMGDFNAKVGNQRVDNTVGPWGIGTENERGSKLIEWCQMNDFTITNTWFQNHPRRQWTWMSPGDRTRNKIDFILIQKRFRNAIKSSKSLPGADCDTDHVPVRCTFQIKLKILKKPKNNPKYQINLLKSDKKLKDQFYVAVKNKFETLESITEAEELWNKMKDLLNDSIKENIPKINKKEHKKWMSKEILDLMEERRKVKNKVTEYKNLNRLIKRKCNNAKENWINEQCQEIEHKKNTDSKYMHSKIKDISGIKSRGSKPELIKNIDGPPILEDEVKAAMRKMKHGKATGPDNIPIEAISALEDLGIKMTTKFLNLIYDSGKIPDGLCKSVFITIPKTPGATECALHRTISLMSHFTKILLRVLMIRMRKSLRPEISKTQFGFVSDKGTRNAICTLSMLMERCVEVQKDLYLCSIDYSKAFDKARRELNDQLNKINAHLKEQSEAQHKIDQMRFENETNLQEELDFTRNSMNEQLTNIKAVLEDKVDELRSEKSKNIRLKSKNTSSYSLDGSNVIINEIPVLLSPQRVINDQPLMQTTLLSSPSIYSKYDPAIQMSFCNTGDDNFSHILRNQLDATIQHHLSSDPQVTLDLPNGSKHSSPDHSSALEQSQSKYISALKRKYFL
ncbi:Craniofacial development protein 2 [Nymphon striatum]|nr:Craniofacial development protein 2 [Nymphon striatum]